MADTSDFKNGLCLEMDGNLFQITYFQHVKPGKGGAFVRTKLRNLNNGRIIDKTFNAGTKVTTARIERRSFQYLYKDETGHIFMDNESYDQIPIEEQIIDHPQFLNDGLEVDILFHAETETPIGCELPKHIVATVTYTEPGLKGDTATNAMKTATIDTGAKVQVPLFIETGEKIKVDTASASYLERHKN